MIFFEYFGISHVFLGCSSGTEQRRNSAERSTAQYSRVVEQRRAEESRAEQSRAEQSSAEQSRAQYSRVVDQLVLGFSFIFAKVFLRYSLSVPLIFVLLCLLLV